MRLALLYESMAAYPTDLLAYRMTGHDPGAIIWWADANEKLHQQKSMLVYDDKEGRTRNQRHSDFIPIPRGVRFKGRYDPKTNELTIHDSLSGPHSYPRLPQTLLRALIRAFPDAELVS